MEMNEHLSQRIFKDLEERIGKKHLSKRLQLQVKHSAFRYGDGRFRIHWENVEPIYTILKYILKSLGLFYRGTLNAMDYRTKEVRVQFENLPRPFRGLRVLHLSDIHIDGIGDNGERLKREISKIDFDLCVITGDFRFLSFHGYGETLMHMEGIVDSLRCEHGVYGVLGNHDFIEMVPSLETMGIRMLLNEAVKIKRKDECIWIAGVDNPTFLEVHDLKKSLQTVSKNDFNILLAHSPDILNDAADLMVDYYLCGHTHGGQICLPGGIPIIINTACSRKYVVGPWRYRKMAGYTSRGTGSSGLAVRFLCPPEITLHRLV